MHYTPHIPWTRVEPRRPKTVSAAGLNAIHDHIVREALTVEHEQQSRKIAWVKILDEEPNEDGLVLGQLVVRDGGTSEANWFEPADTNRVWLEWADDVRAWATEPTRPAIRARLGERWLALEAGVFESIPTGEASPVALPLYTAQAQRLERFPAQIALATEIDENHWSYEVDLMTKADPVSGDDFAWDYKGESRTAYNLAEFDGAAVNPVEADRIVEVFEVLLADGTVEYWFEAAPRAGIRVGAYNSTDPITDLLFENTEFEWLAPPADGSGTIGIRDGYAADPGDSAKVIARAIFHKGILAAGDAPTFVTPIADGAHDIGNGGSVTTEAGHVTAIAPGAEIPDPITIGVAGASGGGAPGDISYTPLIVFDTQGAGSGGVEFDVDETDMPDFVRITGYVAPQASTGAQRLASDPSLGSGDGGKHWYNTTDEAYRFAMDI